MLLEYLFPDLCPLCRENAPAAENKLCSVCSQDLHSLSEPLCEACGATNGTALAVCSACLQTPRPWSQARCGLSFKGHGRDAALQLKYSGQVALAPFLAELALEACRKHPLPAADVVTAVPLHWWRLWRRGFNQAEMMAELMAPALGSRYQPLLRRQRYTRSQTTLDRKKRLKNTENAFALLKAAEVEGLSILLVDDVLTTGGTLAACSKVLLSAGAREVNVVTAFRG